jgi:hypothetical protein
MQTVHALMIMVLFSLAFLSGCAEEEKDQPCSEGERYSVQQSIRPFYMGFTTWPPGPQIRSSEEMYTFIHSHADIIGHQFDGGVPWREALEDGPFSSDIMNTWKRKKENTPSSMKVYVAITPLNDSRENLAPYWGASDNMPLPEPWNTYTFAHDPVKQAYLTYARRVIDYFEPDYLVMGIEVNVLLAADRKKWEQYKEFHAYVYTELKKEHPTIPICASFTLSHMQGLEDAVASEQDREIRRLLDYCDMLGISAYPYGWAYWPSGKLDPVPEDYFDVLRSYGKPIAITETGAPSRDFTALGIDYEFDEDYQKAYIELLLRKAHEYNFVFVINWASIDFDELLEVFPAGEIREIGTIWAYTGLQTSVGCAKKALAVWDAYLHVPYSRSAE